MHPKKEIVCKVKDNVDILPPPTTGIAEMESSKERGDFLPQYRNGSLDTTHVLCTVHTVLQPLRDQELYQIH